MDRTEILEKSRRENKNRDLYTQEIQGAASAVSSFVAVILATVFVVIQAVAGHGVNLGLYAICTSAGATQFIVKAVHMKQKRDIVLAVIYTGVTLVLAGIHIYQLVTSVV